MHIEHSSQFVKARQRRRVVVYLMQTLRLRGPGASPWGGLARDHS